MSAASAVAELRQKHDLPARAFKHAPRPYTRCIRRGCRKPFNEHSPIYQACPDGKGVFRRGKPHHKSRSSTSFSEVEVAILSDLLRGIPLRRDLSYLVRHAAFSKLALKVERIKQSAQARKAELREEQST